MFKELLASKFAPYANLSEVQLNQLESHYLALVRWNEKLNLTRIRDLKEIVEFHYCESLFLAQSLPPGPHQIIDIGSGAGFPGIPVAIARPECRVTLVESHQRKAVFLREVSRLLPNVEVIAKRAEDIQGQYDLMISRAVAPKEVLQLELAENLTLLLGTEDAHLLSGTSSPIPWGNHRVLFHVER
jgi:16S rRNA (guanine(527)-N(7))-methyltransferase RsmG